MMFAKAVAVSLLTLASASVFAAECSVTVDSTDQMSFNTKEIVIKERPSCACSKGVWNVNGCR